MPDRVPLVHRHRKPHHFHFSDDVEEEEDATRQQHQHQQHQHQQHQHQHPSPHSRSHHQPDSSPSFSSPFAPSSAAPALGGPSSSRTIARPKHPAAASLQRRPTPLLSHYQQQHASSSSTPSATPKALAHKPPHNATTNTNKRLGQGGKPAPPLPPHLSSSWPWVLFGSLTLTFNAGYINGITLHNLHHMASAHVTGMVARMSNLIAIREFGEFSAYFVAYSCFILGACMGGLLISHETFYLGRNYARALFLTAAIQGVALLIEKEWDSSVYFVYACCLAMGLQNSLTSKYSGSVVRTTHLTGASTDLGIALGHIMKGRSEEWWKVKLHGIAIFGPSNTGPCSSMSASPPHAP
ncbi:hypothetical protein VYU27_009200 [Nannochloropsis oceanica]